ncbi:MAG: hypothetical protein WC497_02505 [Patescibacteria group bacterium]
MNTRRDFLKVLPVIAGGLLLGCGKRGGVLSPESQEEWPPNGIFPIPQSQLPEQWEYAVYREICYALSRDHYNNNDWGASDEIICNDGCWFAGDWNYRGLGVGIGGQCKSFGSTIVSRATGGIVTLPSGYAYATRSINVVRPGQVIQRSNAGGRIPHTAIVFQVMERDGVGHPTRLDVIDSNFIESNRITRHVLPMWGHILSQYNVW